ncbi:hypothetical protein ACPCHQ_22125 [Ralstonia thomasii]|uniref:hypothetical protein n=1 Tax=Ralstonia thomasii TaxID=3058596 RepID=UPI003C2F2CE8
MKFSNSFSHVAAAVCLSCVAFNATAADTLQWTFKRGADVIATGQAPFKSERDRRQSLAQVDNLVTYSYIARCTPPKERGGQPVTETQTDQHGNKLRIEQVGGSSVRIAASSTHLLSMGTASNNDGCMVQLPNTRVSSFEQTIYLKAGQQVTFGDDEVSVELLLTDNGTPKPTAAK